jgi:hypothetical protein
MEYHKLKTSYVCDLCDFRSSNKTDYERHVNTPKHNKNVQYHTNTHETSTTTGHKYTCPLCKKEFKHRTSIYKHQNVCSGKDETNASTASNAEVRNAISQEYVSVVVSKNQELTTANQELTTANQELRNAMLLLIQQNTEFQSKMMEFCKSGILSNTNNNNNNNNTNNNNTNSHNNITNCNNPTFNMNMFLNEKCKDAMNMKDFVNSIQLNMTDMENMDRLGYVEGMSNIFIDNLQKTDLYKRPVHCSDMKRDTLYVKENDQWEREGPDHAKMTKAVLAVEHKNVVLVNEWANSNPRCLNSNTRENEKYFRLSTIVTDGDKEGNIAKVIRKVAKRVGIERTCEGGE